jgi:FKBP-type peptidyl-prolyl cis-trans isomerase FklB
MSSRGRAQPTFLNRFAHPAYGSHPLILTVSSWYTVFLEIFLSKNKEPLVPHRLLLAFAVFCVCGIAPAQDKPAETPAADKLSPLKTDKEKDSYAIGMDIGNSIVGQNMDIDIELLVRGIRDVIGKKGTLLTKEEHEKQMLAFRDRMIASAQKRQAADAREKFADQAKEGIAFLAENKKKEGVKTTDSGLQYEVIKSGKGATPTKADSVLAHYRGTLIDGTVFDSSYERGSPSEFPVSGVIPGWTEALQLMKVGDKWKIFLPSELGYGAHGAGAKIKPFSTLIFEIELVEVKPAKGE